MKFVAGVAAVAFAAAIALFFQNQNLVDRVELLENASRPIETPDPNPLVGADTTTRVNALSTCLAQLHAQVVTWWNDDKLPLGSRYCKKHFYGLGPRVGD